MRTYLMVGMLFSVIGFADNEIKLTYKNSYNGYGTFAGTVTGDFRGPVGITVKNGSREHSAIAGPKGNWAIVFRHTNFNSDISAWELENPSNRLVTIRATIPVVDQSK